MALSFLSCLVVGTAEQKKGKKIITKSIITIALNRASLRYFMNFGKYLCIYIPKLDKQDLFKSGLAKRSKIGVIQLLETFCTGQTVLQSDNLLNVISFETQIADRKHSMQTKYHTNFFQIEINKHIWFWYGLKQF